MLARESLSGYSDVPSETAADGARIDARPSDLDTDDGERDAREPDIVDLPSDPLLGCSAVGLVAYYPMNVTTGTTVTSPPRRSMNRGLSELGTSGGSGLSALRGTLEPQRKRPL